MSTRSAGSTGSSLSPKRPLTPATFVGPRRFSNHAVFTDEKHGAARDLYADTLEQLAYGSENGTWRNFFLSGATELREGNFGTPAIPAAPAVIAQLSPTQLFDSLAISVNGPRAWDLDLAIDVTVRDLNENYRLTLRNGVLTHRARAADQTAGATVTSTKARLLQLLGGDVASPGLEISGDESILDSLLGVLETGDPWFNIITP
jgi:alkyl sulfatase BDS1-like metallo-beta-lactamase superfamily hydrolase